MIEDNISNIENIAEEMPTTEEQHLLRMATGRERLEEPDVDAEWAKFLAKENPNSENNDSSTMEMPSKRRVHKLLWAMAAAVAAIVIIVTYPLFLRQDKGQDVFVAVVDQPQQVTLEADGNQPMVLKERHADFSYENHGETPPSKANCHALSGKKFSIATSRGMDFEVTLSDGSKVWLNAESRLTFPEHFGSDIREVTVEGEAYFEVTKDTKRPFLVHTKYFTTKVLGTSFNVRTRNQETASVVLVSGKVEVKADSTITMSPGEMVCLDKNNEMQKTPVDTYPFVQWKDGFFYFEKAPLGDIMRELGRWYNINIVFENPRKMDIRMQFVAEKTQSINEIVNSLNSLGGARFTLGDNEITIE